MLRLSAWLCFTRLLGYVVSVLLLGFEEFVSKSFPLNVFIQEFGFQLSNTQILMGQLVLEAFDGSQGFGKPIPSNGMEVSDITQLLEALFYLLIGELSGHSFCITNFQGQCTGHNSRKANYRLLMMVSRFNIKAFYILARRLDILPPFAP
jgi:hypothetical protein